MITAKKLVTALEVWKLFTKFDPVAATLELEKDLESIELEQTLDWPADSRNTPPFLVPNDSENAEIINAILRKSMKTQASTIPPDNQPLSDRNNFIKDFSELRTL